jgi:hypothetical protein
MHTRQAFVTFEPLVNFEGCELSVPKLGRKAGRLDFHPSERQFFISIEKMTNINIMQILLLPQQLKIK